MKSIRFYLIMFFVLISTSLMAEDFTLSFKNSCAGTSSDNEIILHNIEYNNTKVWAKFQFNINTLSFQLVDAGMESEQSSTSSDEVKEVILDTSGDNREHAMIVFSTGSYTTDWNNFDVGLEPWCRDNVAMCGNYADIGEKSLSDVTVSDIPTSGLDNKPGSYCNDMELNHVYINKNNDGSYTAFSIVSHEKVGDWNSWCNHKATIQYKNLK